MKGVRQEGAHPKYLYCIHAEMVEEFFTRHSAVPDDVVGMSAPADFNRTSGGGRNNAKEDTVAVHPRAILVVHATTIAANGMTICVNVHTLCIARTAAMWTTTLARVVKSSPDAHETPEEPVPIRGREPGGAPRGRGQRGSSRPLRVRQVAQAAGPWPAGWVPSISCSSSSRDMR